MDMRISMGILYYSVKSRWTVSDTNMENRGIEVAEEFRDVTLVSRDTKWVESHKLWNVINVEILSGEYVKNHF